MGLARREGLELDLCNNPLSSPPLGRRADIDTLREYLAPYLLPSLLDDPLMGPSMPP